MLVAELLLFLGERWVDVDFALVVGLHVVFRLGQGLSVVLLFDICLVDLRELWQVVFLGRHLVQLKFRVLRYNIGALFLFLLLLKGLQHFRKSKYRLRVSTSCLCLSLYLVLQVLLDDQVKLIEIIFGS